MLVQINNDLNLLTSLFVKGSAIIDGNWLVRGTITSSSDLRLKDNIEPVADDLCINIIKSIQPKTYIRNDITNSKEEIGFIAQDLKEQLPSPMSYIIQEVPHDTHGTIYAIDYSRLTTILWGTCRNLLARVEALETALNNK